MAAPPAHAGHSGPCRPCIPFPHFLPVAVISLSPHVPVRTLFCLARLGGEWGVVVRSACTTSPLLIQILPEVSTVREGLFPQDYLSRV